MKIAKMIEGLYHGKNLNISSIKKYPELICCMSKQVRWASLDKSLERKLSRLYFSIIEHHDHHNLKKMVLKLFNKLGNDESLKLLCKVITLEFSTYPF